MEIIEKINVLIVTAADGEDQAVRKIFGEDWERIAPTPLIKFYWHKITLRSKKDRRFTIALIRSDMGADNAGPITQKMVSHLRPNFIAMCGICAGHPDDTKLGEVIIASKVFRYDRKSIKILPDGSLDEKWDITTFSLAQPWWQLAKLLDEDIPNIRVHTAPMATGEALCRNPAVWKEIGNYERKCIGLEMEASVIGQIGHIEEKRWVVIKGVSDHATPEKNDQYHILAKENAAIVLKEFLENVADELPSIDDVSGIWAPPIVFKEKTMNLMNNAPSTLLHAKNENVPFSDAIRQQEFEALQALCQSGQASHGIIQLFIGPGGIGKTRLMIEWIRRLKNMDTSWQTCFLTQGVDPANQNFKDIFSQDYNLFFAIDYAECRINLSTILRVLIAAATEKPDRMIRVVLVARNKGIWWEELASNNLDIKSYLHDHVVELQSIPIHDNIRQHHFDSVFHTFAKILNNFPTEETKTDVYTMLSDPLFGRTLYIHMAAYATVVGLNFTAQTLLDVIVSYEKHFWAIQFRQKIDGDQAKAKFIRETARVLTALTMFGGVDNYDKLSNLINMSKGPDDDLFIEFIRNFYPPAYPSKIVGCLEPDLLGEHLVFDTLRSLRNHPIPFNDSVFLTNTFNLTDDPDELQQAFTVLGRIAEHDACKTNSVKTMIEEWLSLPFDERHLGSRSLPAVGAAVSLAEKTAFCPIPDILTKALEKYGSISLALELWKVLPSDSVAFRRLQLWVAKTNLSDKKNKERLTCNQQSEYANALVFYSTALVELGQHEDALEAIYEAVDIYRLLVESDTDIFLSGLARSLDSLGNILSELGQYEKALETTHEAVEKYRLLVKSRPDDFLFDLPGSISNLGNRLSELGQFEESLEVYNEAVCSYRTLKESYPDTVSPYLAMSLNNLGNNFKELGRHEEAIKIIQEAVDIYQSLTESRPDAYIPYFADSLISLGHNFTELGKHNEALKATSKAVDNYRALTKSHLNNFLPDLAMSLDNLGNNLCKLGKKNEALETTQEAVNMYRSLSVSYPDTFLSDLARSLDNLGIRLSNFGHHKEALKATQEAVDIYQSLSKSFPDIFLFHLARSLNNLGVRYSNLDQHEEALEVTRVAVDTYRLLYTSYPDTYLSHLARGLNNLGNKLSDLDRNKEALEIAQEAVEKYRQLVVTYPDTFLPELAMSLYNLGVSFNYLGLHEDALKVTIESVSIYQPLAESHPDVFLPDLVMSLNSLGATLSELGRYEEALEIYKETTPVTRQLQKNHSHIFEEHLYQNLLGKNQVLQKFGRENEMPLEEISELKELKFKFS
ncbi:MAG: tetratricopeptide repeat protein [Treponema sp.]|nr:tetratricopeptide repeat protein [Treponema sp.]